MTYLWMERTRGREFTLQQIQQEVIPLALAEPVAGSGESLIDSSSEVYYRTKAAAVLWMLRTVAGRGCAEAGATDLCAGRAAGSTAR